MTRLAAAAIAALALVLPHSGPRAETLTVRALGPQVPTSLIRFIARNAKPVVLDPAFRETLPDKTPRAVILLLCGWTPKSYYSEFIDANAAAIHAAKRWPLLDSQKLGSLSDKLVWPACLYVNNNPSGERALPTDSPRSVYTRLVGGDGTASALQNFYSQEGESLAAVRTRIVRRKPVSAPWSTAPVELTPTPDMSLADFQNGLNHAAATPKYPAIAVVRKSPPRVGVFVTDADDDKSGGTDTPQCQMKGKVPYPSAAVASAYAHSYGWQQRENLAPNRVEVFVVDNGFFGANPQKAPHFIDPFAKAYFPNWMDKPDQLVGPAVLLDKSAIYPSNFYYVHAAPDPVSGHGTHVAGLVLGGSDLDPAVRRKLFSPGQEGGSARDPAVRRKLLSRGQEQSWLSMSILNAGMGSRYPQQGALGRIQYSLDAIHPDMAIVNFSLMFFDNEDKTDVADIRNLISNDKTDLFVVAAGNGSFRISRDAIFPAALGGASAPNVITVAALDWSNSLAAFTDMDSEYVDIAAPGCRISSWIGDKAAPMPLSGTSQAAPLVTFAAALLRSLDGAMTPTDIKSRLIVSSDMIVPRADGSDTPVWSGARLNIPAALYLFEDYIRFDRHDGTGMHEYLGRLTDSKNVVCNATDEYDVDDIWSYKRDGARQLLFTGRNNPGAPATAPCDFTKPSTADGKGEFLFIPAFEIKNGAIQNPAVGIKGKSLPPLPLNAVSLMVRGIPL
jgi:subtilisin family serine protease